MTIIKNCLKVASVALALSTSVTFAQADDLKIAAAFPAGVENAWVASWIHAFERVKENAPHGVNLDLAYTEGVFGDKGLEVLEAYSETGEYDVIWAHSSYSDEVEELMEEYPDILYVTVGAGNRPLGKNSYLIYMHLHEPSYLAGIFAGLTTQGNTLGAVGLFPADDVNDQINAFKAGAQSVNPDAKTKVTFIESWYDPAKASEAANAQIAAGADIIYQLGESFQVCKEHNILCIGNYTDQSEIAPEVVPVSAMVNWEPQIGYIIDEWKKHKESGDPYDAPMEQVWFGMAKGGGDLSAFNPGLNDRIPAEAKDAVAAARNKILAGELTVELDTSLPTSD